MKGRKELVIGGYTQPKPSPNLEKRDEISPDRGKVPEKIRQLEE